MLLVTLLAACAQDWQIAREDRTTGFVNQLDGTPEDDPEPGLTAQDPTSPDVSTRGTRFPFAVLQGPSPFVEGPPELELWIESEVATQAEIVGPASGFGLQVALVPGVNVVPLPTRQLEPVASNFVFDTGLELLTEDPVHVVAVHHRRRFTEATRLLPLEELGVNHRVVAVPDVDEASPSSFVVLATADETRVTIQPAVATTDFRPPFVGYDVELQAGEVVQVQAHGDLTGSLVTADRKVAVFSGGQAPVVDCDGPQHAWEQMPPVSRWATDWLVAPWPDQPYQYAVVVAREPGTVVSLDCTFVAKLGPGESSTVRLDQAGRIRANQPVLVAQLAVGGTCERDDDTRRGDPNLLLGAPTALSRSGARIHRLEHPTFGDADERRDRLVTFSETAGQLAFLPRPSSVTRETPEGFVAEAALLTRDTIVQGPLRGFLYGVTEDDAYAHTVGIDCSGCGPALAAPAACD